MLHEVEAIKAEDLYNREIENDHEMILKNLDKLKEESGNLDKLKISLKEINKSLERKKSDNDLFSIAKEFSKELTIYYKHLQPFFKNKDNEWFGGYATIDYITGRSTNLIILNKKSNIVFSESSSLIEIFIIIYNFNKEYKKNEEGYDYWKYLSDIIPDKKLKLVGSFDYSWKILDEINDVSLIKTSIINGPWWDCIKNKLLPELKLFNINEEKKRLQNELDDKLNKKVKEMNELASWSSE